MAVTQMSKGLAAELLHHTGDESSVSRLARVREQLQAQADKQDHPHLLATIEAEIIPRLMLAHRVESASRILCAESRLPPTQDELIEFARIASCHDLPGALAFVESLCLQGLSLETVLLDLIGPTARLLGDQWLADQRSFTAVSAGLGTLQQVVHILGPSFAPAHSHRGLVVLLAAPGEQHTLGLYLIAEFLRRAGWGVQVTPEMSESELVQLVGTQRVEMVGITVSNGHLLKPLAALMDSARRASRNPSLKLAIGGSLQLEEFAAQNRVSLCAKDPLEVVRYLEPHGSLRARRN